MRENTESLRCALNNKGCKGAARVMKMLTGSSLVALKTTSWEIGG